MSGDIADRLAEAAARNRAALGPTHEDYVFRIVFADGREIEERHIGFSQIAARYPDAALVVNLTLRPEGVFW
jgi:hypothetical protein